MIVSMKKASILCLSNAREQSLEALRELGVLHIEVEKLNQSEDRARLEQLHMTIEKTYGILAARKTHHTHNLPDIDPEVFIGQASALIDEKERLSRELETLYKQEIQLEPWGDFSAELLSELQKKGINIALCAANAKQYEELCTRFNCHLVSRTKEKCYFAVISNEVLDNAELPTVSVPEDIRLSDVHCKIMETRRRMAQLEKDLDKAASEIKILERYRDDTKHKLEFMSARDAMAEHGQLTAISGYVPEPEIETLRRGAIIHGWALQFNDPEPDELVPTLIEIPKVFKIINPVFDFLGIAPGYHEMDVSICFLFFFTIFFGMILGDAGYGSLFLLAGIICKLVFRGKKFVLPINLLIVLSLMTIAWGGLSGNWFGISAPGLKILTDPSVKDQYVQFFCFILAIAHLTTGRFWQALRTGKVRKFLGQIGWALVLWGNFFLILKLLVFPGAFPEIMYWFYIAGVILIVTCDINWLDVSEAFNFPFGLIGTFVDMLSYIRLFAVGMAGYYIAVSFNGMGSQLFETNLAIGILVGIPVILFGHALNIALCMLGVLVHGVRLNTLEFSNHVGLRWAGFVYNPFKNNLENKIIEGEVKND